MTTKPPPQLAIFRRHSLLDGFSGGYASSPGDRSAHPTLGPFPFNVGDHFVSLAVAKLLRIEEFCTLKHGAPQRYFDYVNENCKAFIVVSQNSLHTGFFEKFLPPSFLGKIKIPMIFMSLGVQFEFDEVPVLTKGDVESLKIIHDKCESSQLRGNISAELLAKHGIHNTRVLGCPSLLWSCDRDRVTRPPEFDRVGWTITDMNSRPQLDELQGKAMGYLADRSVDLVPIAQGGEIVLQSYLAARDGLGFGNRLDRELEIPVDGELSATELVGHNHVVNMDLVKSTIHREDVSKLEADLRWYYRHYPQSAIDAIVEKSFFSHEVSSFLHNARSLSLMTGTRLHGNIMALSQGVPTVFFPHDQRTREMVDLFEVPAFDLSKPEIELDSSSFERFDRKYRELYDGFASFFEENGLAHRL